MKNGQVYLGVYSTSVYSNAVVFLKAGDKIISEDKVSIAPDKPFTKTIKLVPEVKPEDMTLSLLANGRNILSYTPVVSEKQSLPKEVTPPLSPKEIMSNEELYLTGLRIQQFHNPALDPYPYWEEALCRDSGDTRVNAVMGISYLKKAIYAEAEKHLKRAINRLSDKYTSPKDGEAYYYLGIALRLQGKEKEAYDAFYKATWNEAWNSAGYFSLAEMDCARKDFTNALAHLNRSLITNSWNTKALALKASVLRYLGKAEEQKEVLATIRQADPLDLRVYAENWLADKDNAADTYQQKDFAQFPMNALEIAMDLSHAGLWNDATSILKKYTEVTSDKTAISPLIYYSLAYFSQKAGLSRDAGVYYRQAASMSPDYVFPFQYEIIPVLEEAMKINPSDAHAPYYLGNLLFDWQPDKAILCWEKSRGLDSSFSIVHRNLAIGYSLRADGLNKAIASLEKAVSLTDRKAIQLFELDDLYATAGVSTEKRLSLFEKYHETVVQRDDALSKEIFLKINNGKYQEAISMMQGRYFNVWEGGARFSVNDLWTDVHLLQGRHLLSNKKYKGALEQFKKALVFPPNLQAARNTWSGRDAEINYWIGIAYEALGDKQNAARFWRSASATISKIGNDDVLPTTNLTVLLYYQALSLDKLDKKREAADIYAGLIKAGEKALTQTKELNFFAKFGQQQSERNKQAMAHYIIALGYMGQNRLEEAKKELQAALNTSPDYLGAKMALVFAKR